MTAKFVPKLLTEQQKELRKEIFAGMLDFANHDPEVVKFIITSDEPGFVVTTQKSSFIPHNGSTRNHQSPKKFDKFALKVILTCFFDSRNVVHHERVYAPQGQATNNEYYQEVLRLLHDAVRKKIFSFTIAKNSMPLVQ